MTFTDEELCEQVRLGSVEVFSELWLRHQAEALGYARKLNPRIAEDAVSEVMTVVLEALRAGKGPDRSFRSYILLSVRNTIFRGNSNITEDPLPDEQLLAAEEATPALELHEEIRTVHEAIEQLPERWREVLTLSDIQRKSLAEVGAVMGLESNAVSALLRRARSGLRRSWVAAHFSGSKLSTECGTVVEAFGDFRWGKPSDRQRQWFERHISECHDCVERQGTHAWLAQAVGLGLLPAIWLGGATLKKGSRLVDNVASTAKRFGADIAGMSSGTLVTGIATVAAALFVVGVITIGIGTTTPSSAVNGEAQNAAVDDGSDAAAEMSTESTSPDTNRVVDDGTSSATHSAADEAEPSHADTTQGAAQPSSSQLDVPSHSAQLLAPEESHSEKQATSAGPSTPAAEPTAPSVWDEIISGSSRPGATLEFMLSDSSVVSTTADASGNFAVTIAWSSLKPAFGYSLQRVS